jgi:hypothetical protein
MTNNTRTYVATVRVDIRSLAKIARFLAKKGMFLGTKGKLASEGIRIIADNLGTSCETFKEAVLILTELGYENPRGLETRCEKQITIALETEASKETLQEDLNAKALELVKEFNTKITLPSKEAKEEYE